MASAAPRQLSLFATDRSLAPVALRLTLAAVMLSHGLQKALGWFGGWSIDGQLTRRSR